MLHIRVETPAGNKEGTTIVVPYGLHNPSSPILD